jgi:hypothetical protein
VSYIVAYEGTETDAAPYAARFQALCPISTKVYSNVSYVDLYTVFHNDLKSQSCVQNNNIAGAGISLPAWDLPGVRKAFMIFSNLTSDARFAKSFILMENYGMHGVHAVDSTSISLAVEERELPILAGPVLWWEGDDKQTIQEAYAYTCAIRDALYMGVDKSIGKRHSYVNYANGDEKTPELYGDDWRLEKLIELKKVWDPKNRFGFYNPIVQSI